MTGSDGETGRRPGAASNVFSDAAQCFVCDRQQPVASCEVWERVKAWLKGREPRKMMWGRPQRLRVCKDCCIARLDGHQCVWWSLCWGEYPGQQ